MMNTNDLLFYAQKSAVCPLRAIFDSSRGQLTEACKVALERIFKLCDKDVDGVLNDAELNAFQEVCYGGSLQPHELESVKNMVRGRCPQGVTPEGLNLLGFQFLQAIFIHDSKPEMPWTVLRKFGYGLDLQLTEEYLNPVVHVAPEQSAELSSNGIQFFSTLFRRYDKDHDSALSASELDTLFATTPGIPWGKSFTENTITDFNGNVTLRGFLAMWNMTTQLDYAITLRYLSYLGCEAPKEAVRFTYKSASGAKANVSPAISTVLLCYVFGANSVGKTSLLKSFIEKPFYDVHIPTEVPYSVANVVNVPQKSRAPPTGDGIPLPGDERYLVVSLDSEPFLLTPFSLSLLFSSLTWSSSC
jgi:Ras family protein T1